MKMVYLNGQFLAPNGAISSSSNDFYFKNGRLYFELGIKCTDIVAVVKTLLGITWSRRYYRLSNNCLRVPPNTPLKLSRGGEMIPERDERATYTSGGYVGRAIPTVTPNPPKIPPRTKPQSLRAIP